MAKSSASVKRKPAASKQASKVRKAAVRKAPPVEPEWSYDRLWDAAEVSSGWHGRNVRFWRSQSADMRGATGGGVTQFDVGFSRQALRALATARGGKRFARALDLGAGIGRVTDGVLRHHCRHVDLVEFVSKHLQRAKQLLPAKGKSGCTFSFHAAAVQKHPVPARSYDLVWCQWLLMYLTDADVLTLLRRLAPGLCTDGFLLVKENVSTPEKLTYFDAEDGELWEEGDGGRPVSCVRTRLHYEDLFERAGLRVRAAKVQHDSSSKIMDMVLFVLTPATRGADLETCALVTAAWGEEAL